MDAMIEADGLSKSFRIARRRPGLLGGLRSVVDPDARIVEAVHDLSLRIERSEMIGLIGPNGAGKSTTIKMLTGILVPTSGQVSVARLNPVRQRTELARRIGVVFGQRSQLWWDLPLIDSLRLLRFLYRVPEKRHANNLERLRAMLALDEFIDTPVRQLSLGQRMGGERALIAEFSPGALASVPHDSDGQPILSELPAGVRQARAEAPYVRLNFERDAIPAHELVAWLGARYQLRDVTFQEPEIEDVIRRIYEQGLLLQQA